MRVWFNKTFSSIQSALRLIRQGDPEQTYYLLASSSAPHALVRLAADEFHTEPSGLKGPDYVAWCVDFCRAQKIDIFVPGKEAALLAAAAETFARGGTRLLSSAPPAMLELLHDKGRFYGTVDCPSAPPPAWLPCTSFPEFEAAYASLREQHAQVCIKPAMSVYGIGFRRIREDLGAYDIFAGGYDYQIDLASLQNMLCQQESFPTLLVMEYLGGHEFSVDCLADQGALQCAIPRRKPLSAGHGQVIDLRADILAACTAVVHQFALNGYINIQFREGTAGLRLLEVNPRMSGGIAMACLAGPNLPYLGLAGFDRGYGKLDIPKPEAGRRVGEYPQAVVFD